MHECFGQNHHCHHKQNICLGQYFASCVKLYNFSLANFHYHIVNCKPQDRRIYRMCENSSIQKIQFSYTYRYICILNSAWFEKSAQIWLWLKICRTVFTANAFFFHFQIFFFWEGLRFFMANAFSLEMYTNIFPPENVNMFLQ
jgi:hypothetical protein